MVIPILVGVFAGVVGVGCFALVHLVLNFPAIHEQLNHFWYLAPPLIGAVAAVLHSLAGWRQRRNTAPLKKDNLTDILESYFFGVFRIAPMRWVARGVVSVLNALIGGIFGIEGGILELCFSTLPFFSRFARFFIEERQTFVVCALSSSLGVALGAPFSGILITLELLHVLEARVRGSAVLAALVAYGTATFLQSIVPSTFFIDGNRASSNIISYLFSGLEPLHLEAKNWLFMSLAAVVVGLGGGALSSFSSRMFVKAAEAYQQLTRKRAWVSFLVTGVSMGVLVWLVPEAYTEPHRLWYDLAWLKLSSLTAFVILIAHWSLLLLAFSGWGSSGLFTSALVLGSLFGYSLGGAIAGLFDLQSALLPLTISGAVSVLCGLFAVPVAASALVLEVGRDPQVWCIATIAVIAARAMTFFLGTRPLHEILASRRGVRIVGGRVASLLGKLKTMDAMYTDFVTISDDASLFDLRDAVVRSRHNFIGVLSMDEKFLGLLALERMPSQIRRVLNADATSQQIQALERVVEIRDLVDSFTPTVSLSESLEKALEILQESPCVPVVDEDRRLCGLLFESSIVGRYKHEVASIAISDR
ncbi:MAG: chloride channel protein [Bdellovibrionota bacterium]